MTDFKEIIAKQLEKMDLGLGFEEIYKLIEIPPQDNMGDYSFPCFSLAKTLRKNPAIIAEDLAKGFDIDGFEKIENLNAYLNFYVDRKVFEEEILK